MGYANKLLYCIVLYCKMGSPSHRSVYLITFSQCDSSQQSRLQFAEVIVEAWHTC